jgi:competence protein ComEA
MCGGQGFYIAYLSGGPYNPENTVASDIYDFLLVYIELVMRSRNFYYANKITRLAVLAVGAILLTAFVFSSFSKEPSATPWLSGNSTSTQSTKQSEDRININTASLRELMSLPTIGQVTGSHIIEYREKHGQFKHTSDIIIVRGISEHKFRQLEPLITVE